MPKKQREPDVVGIKAVGVRCLGGAVSQEVNGVAAELTMYSIAPSINKETL